MRPIRWKHHRAEGLKLLASIAPTVDEQAEVLGPDYTRFLAMLDGKPDPNPQAGRRKATVSSSGNRSKEASRERPAKRRKTTYDEDDVIDLT